MILLNSIKINLRTDSLINIPVLFNGETRDFLELLNGMLVQDSASFFKPMVGKDPITQKTIEAAKDIQPDERAFKEISDIFNFVRKRAETKKSCVMM